MSKTACIHIGKVDDWRVKLANDTYKYLIRNKEFLYVRQGATGEAPMVIHDRPKSDSWDTQSHRAADKMFYHILMLRARPEDWNLAAKEAKNIWDMAW